VRSSAELSAGLAAVGLPAVMKTAAFGYDGKGQALVRSTDEAATAWVEMGSAEAILERFIDFEREVSVVAARGLDGHIEVFPLFENAHAHHILDLTLAPARVSSEVADAALEIARGVLAALDVVGVLCVELFVGRDGALYINELAPRPHNSGHLTIEACLTSQFEQQVRAICGLPLGSPAQFAPAAMANLLGDLWAGGEPDWAAALTDPAVKLHLYGKASPRPARKMGHLTALGADVEEACDRVMRARARLMQAAP
jgi:5-(carboxyamino)imidazole ribonucleotide synthase